MKELTFEESMNKLENLAKDLEKDDLTLDESVKKFEEGMELSKNCKEILDKAERKITILIDGKEENFVQKEEE